MNFGQVVTNKFLKEIFNGVNFGLRLCFKVLASTKSACPMKFTLVKSTAHFIGAKPNDLTIFLNPMSSPFKVVLTMVDLL